MTNNSSPILLESLKRLDMKLYRSKPHGNCFFSSLSKYFNLSNNTQGTAKDIRKNVIQFIKENQYVFDYISNVAGMTPNEIDDDLYELRQQGVYDLDIFDVLPVIIATQYNIKLCIYTWIELSDQYITKKDMEMYLPIKYQGNNIKRNLNEISLLYSNLEHYDLLYPLNNKIES